MSKHTEQEEDEGNDTALGLFVLGCMYIIILILLVLVLL
jgi:hypothetical protein